MASPFGAVPGIITGVGVGTAAAAAIEPLVEPAKQAAWAANQHRILEPGVIASLVAQGAINLKTAEDEAALHGFTPDKMDALVYLAQTVPGFAQAMMAYRRGTIAQPEWRHVLAKTGIDARYLAALDDLKDDRLSPPVIGLAIVRGLMKDPGFLPVGPPTAVGRVPAFPVSPLDPVAEAAASGFNLQRLFIEAAIAGRPMGPEAAAAAVFRDIIDPVDYDRAIAEGDVRNEWAQAIFETARQIPSAANFIQEHLRGWVPAPTMYVQTARHGMSQADTNTLFNISGRPLSFHQVFIGLARGGVYGGPTAALDPAFLKALQESDIRPEWYNLAWAQRYSYPSAFVLRALTQGGDLTQAETEQILLFIGWEPTLANTVSTKWASSSAGATTDPHERLALNQAIASLKKSFILERSDGQAVLDGLQLLGLSAATAGNMLQTWTLEQGWTEKLLTPAQVKKLYTTNQLALDQAIAELQTRHYSIADATAYLTS